MEFYFRANREVQCYPILRTTPHSYQGQYVGKRSSKLVLSLALVSSTQNSTLQMFSSSAI